MKKKIFLIVLIAGSLFSARTFASRPDTIQVLKERMAKMEQQVQQLQAELKLLRLSDSSLSAELKDIRKTNPRIATRSRKLVIDRRGSKQAYLQ